MYRFWDHIIGPICTILKPGTIVEIGIETGKNTRNILSYCKNNNAVLHAIDPNPRITTSEWEKEFPHHLVIHQNLSLNALGKIPSMDMICIDGDHNWYTIYHELKILEKTIQDGESFPCVFLHDTQWPYGRRDVYYNPECIPEIYRQPYKKDSISHAHSCLGGVGINQTDNNSVYENSLRNGVKTAIEDFLKETPLDLHYREISGFHGLGIIMTSQQKELLSSFLQDLTVPDVIGMHIQQLEEERCSLKAASESKTHDLQNLKKTHLCIQKSFLKLHQKYGKISNELVASQEQYNQCQQSLHDLGNENTALQQSLHDLGNENTALQQSLHDLGNENTALQQSLHHILQTASWKCTHILRLFGSIFKKS